MNRTSSPSRLMLFVGLLCLVLYAMAFQGSRGLWEPDEGRYTDVAMEMLHSNDFIHPALHNEHPHYTKPPMTYWVIAWSVKAFGNNEWAARLPYALAFVLTVMLIYGAGRLYLPERPWLPPVIYATLFAPYLAANVVTTDTILTLFEALAGVGYLAFLHEYRRRLAINVMWLGFGLAFLTKGPPGLLPLLAIVVFHARTYGWRQLKQVLPLSGLALFAVVGLSWYLVLIITKPEILDYFVEYEVVGRVFTNVHRRNPEWYGGLLVYVPTLLLGILPWGAIAGYRAFRRWREGTRVEADSTRRFLWYWILIPLVIFFLARSRLPLYILPLFTPMSLLLAKSLSSWVTDRPVIFRSLLLLSVAILLSGKWYLSIHEHSKNTGMFYAELKKNLKKEYEEVIFIDKHPRYALSLYMDVEVEDICFMRDCLEVPGLYHQETLYEELEDYEPNRLYMIDVSRQNALKNYARKWGIQVHPITTIDDTLVVTLKSEKPSPTGEPEK